MTGQRLSHYEILELLGRGGMGVVYKAKDNALGRFVAIKFLAPQSAPDETHKQRFILEAQAASSFDHPNICTIHEIGTAPDGHLYIVMAFHEGETLKAKIARMERLAIDEVRQIGMQIASGLAKAHAKGVVHCDIKPANIIITSDGIAKIVDFGVCKLLADTGTIATGAVAGTPVYMAPEQFIGVGDQRSDLWSLGVVLYEMLTKDLPFRDEETESLRHRILHERLISARELRPDIPLDLNNVVERCLEKEPANRYQAAEQIVSELRGLSTSASTPTSSDLQRRLINSIAVLPFANLTSDDENDYFSDGLTEELIHALSQIQGLRVVSRTSAFEFKGRSADVRTIGNRLQVAAVLEGGVRRMGNKLRVTAQLTDAANGYHLWSRRFDRDLKDVFAIQDDIAMTVAEMLKLELRDQPVVARHGGNLDAYSNYLKGRFCWHNKQTAEGFEQAIAYFQAAVELEPQHAPALAGLADIYMSLGWWGLVPPMTVWPKAEEKALAAVSADPNAPEAHIVLARCAQFLYWDRRRADREFQRAIELNRTHGDALFAYGVFLAQLGRLKPALEHTKRARDLDPLNMLIATGVAWMHYYLGEHDSALAECNHVVDLQPQYFEAQGLLGLIYEKLNRPEESLQCFEKAVVLSGESPTVLAFLGRAYAQSGQEEPARQVLERLQERSKLQYVPPVAFAFIEIALREYEAALDSLERAFENRDAFLCYAKVFPPYDPVRSHPRFIDLLTKMDLADSSQTLTQAM